jgi:hypothetical protein
MVQVTNARFVDLGAYYLYGSRFRNLLELDWYYRTDPGPVHG